MEIHCFLVIVKWNMFLIGDDALCLGLALDESTCICRSPEPYRMPPCKLGMALVLLLHMWFEHITPTKSSHIWGEVGILSLDEKSLTPYQVFDTSYVYDSRIKIS